MINTIIYCACGSKDCSLQMSVDWLVHQPGHIVVVVFTTYGDACHEEFTYAEFLAKLDSLPSAALVDGLTYSLPAIVGNVQTFLIDHPNLNRLIAITKENAHANGIAL